MNYNSKQVLVSWCALHSSSPIWRVQEYIFSFTYGDGQVGINVQQKTKLGSRGGKMSTADNQKVRASLCAFVAVYVRACTHAWVQQCNNTKTLQH